jgi:hypothetical protein
VKWFLTSCLLATSVTACGEEPGSEVQIESVSMTQAGCRFVRLLQQADRSGDALTEPRNLLSAGHDTGVTVDLVSDDWYVGQDVEGITVLVSRTSGEVYSHGLIHVGKERSSIAPDLSLPLTLR